MIWCLCFLTVTSVLGKSNLSSQKYKKADFHIFNTDAFFFMKSIISRDIIVSPM